MIVVHHSDVTIIGDNGTMIDAEGYSRHFDVALGGRLHLENLHLLGGGSEMIGGSILVRYGGSLTTNNVRMTDSRVHYPATAVCCALFSAAC